MVFNKIYKMDSKIGFEMSLIVVEALRGRCASFMIITATVWEIFVGKTNSPIFSSIDIPSSCLSFNFEIIYQLVVALTRSSLSYRKGLLCQL